MVFASLALALLGYQLPAPRRHAASIRTRSLFASLDADGSEGMPSAPALSLLSPAKVNLFLRILRRREDGYHELASLFQAVSLFDRLDFWERPGAAGPSMEVTDDSVCAALIPTDERNLVMRALQIFAERSGDARPIHCRLHKVIPAQAGMGGGSGDAATALHAANRLCGFPVSQETLIEWGAELGSDIGFFLSRGTAFCTGRGELIEPLDPLPPAPVYLVKPAEGLSTPGVFKALGLSPNEELPGASPQALLDEFAENVYTATFVNDLEPPAEKVLPMLADLRTELSTLGFRAVMLSGSGTTIFCVGTPRGDVVDTWQDAIRAKFDVEVYEEMFCRRLPDERLWYAEQPEGAKLVDLDDSLSSSQAL